MWAIWVTTASRRPPDEERWTGGALRSCRSPRSVSGLRVEMNDTLTRVTGSSLTPGRVAYLWVEYTDPNDSSDNATRPLLEVR
jgi:hypothetical protein